MGGGSLGTAAGAPHPPAGAVVVSPAAPAEAGHAVELRALRYAYPGEPPVLAGCSLGLPPGSRCLLVGENGAGKSTALQVLAGHLMVPKDQVRVLGRPAFHDTRLTTSGDLSYLGGTWRQDVAFAGYGVALQGDFAAGEMIRNVKGTDLARVDHLIKMLDIDEGWRMTKVSDGQRRRVQICMGLLKEYRVLLLDEITVDLDLVGRLDLLAFFKRECEERGATIVYATHIFDGMDHWADHVAYVARGQLQEFGPAAAYPELAEGRLVELVERWLRQEQAIVAELRKKNPQQFKQEFKYALNNGWGSGRLAATIKLSSNAVWRC